MNSKIEIMGVLNITDNSFYDGGKFNNLKESINHAKRLINDGADIIDIGAESSKPGSDPVSSKDQIRKIEPLVEALREVSNISISIDTRSSEVINQLLKYKINIVNDISSLEDKNLLDIVKCNKLSISLMHMLGTPKTMQVNPNYNDVVNNDVSPAGLDLTGQDFSQYDLTGLDFTDAELGGAIFTDAELAGVNLTNATLDDNQLDDALFNGTTGMEAALASGVIFTGTVYEASVANYQVSVNYSDVVNNGVSPAGLDLTGQDFSQYV